MPDSLPDFTVLLVTLGIGFILGLMTGLFCAWVFKVFGSD